MYKRLTVTSFARKLSTSAPIAKNPVVFFDIGNDTFIYIYQTLLNFTINNIDIDGKNSGRVTMELYNGML